MVVRVPPPYLDTSFVPTIEEEGGMKNNEHRTLKVRVTDDRESNVCEPCPWGNGFSS